MSHVQILSGAPQEITIMQKLINVLAVLSFVGTASIIGGGIYLYTQKDAITEKVKEEVVNGVAEVLPELISDAVGGIDPTENLAKPEIPSGLPF